MAHFHHLPSLPDTARFVFLVLCASLFLQASTDVAAQEGAEPARQAAAVIQERLDQVQEILNSHADALGSHSAGSTWRPDGGDALLPPIRPRKGTQDETRGSHSATDSLPVYRVRLQQDPAVEAALAAVRADADAWFDWYAMQHIAAAGLEHDLGIPSQFAVPDLRHFIDLHMPLLHLGLRLRTGEERFEVLDSRTHVNGDVTVNARLTRNSQPLVHLAFRVRSAGATFRFVDIRFNGYSLLQAARSWYFRQWQQTELPSPR